MRNRLQLDYASRVRSFAVAFNYLILAYLRLNYLRINYLRLIYTQFLSHFLTAILLFLVLGCIIIIIIHIFLFQTCSANFDRIFLMGTCFLHYWPAPSWFKSFVL